MDYYRLMKKKTFVRRAVLATVFFIVAIFLLLINIGEVTRYFAGTVDICSIDVDNRTLSKLEDEYVEITVTDLQGYVNGFDGEQKGLLYGILPTTKCGWIAGYEGCTQYCELITYGKYNDDFEEKYKELIAYDEGKGNIPDINIKITGKVVKKNKKWDNFFTMYANELVGSGKYKSVSDVKKNMSGDYMIDMSYNKPVKPLIGLIISIISILISGYIMLGYLLGTGRKKMRSCFKKYCKGYSKQFIYDDYNNGYAIGTTVISNRFIYFIKGLDYEMFSLENIYGINRKKMLLFSKIIVTDMDGRKYSFYVNKKYSKKLVKVVRDVIEEIAEFGIVD